MKHQKLKLIAAAALLLCHGAEAGVEDSMRDFFRGSYVNTTEASVYQGAMRGAVTGGGVRARFPIVAAPQVGFVPPSFRAGCGGISITTGSMSWPSTDEFRQWANGLKDNAVGLGVEMALKEFPDISAVVDKMRDWTLQVNRYLKDSCSAARAGLQFGMQAVNAWQSSSATVANSQSGDETDPYSAERDGPQNRGTPAQQNQDFRANPIWEAAQSAGNWFAIASKVDLRSLLVSLTGMVIFTQETASDGNRTLAKQVIPATLDLQDLLRGTQGASVYSCSGHCEDPSLVEKTAPTFLGLEAQVYNLLVGTGGDGIVDKMASGNEDLTAEQKALVEAVRPTVAMTSLRMLSSQRGLAREYASAISSVVAKTTICDMAKQSFGAVMHAMENQGDDGTKAIAAEFVNKRWSEIQGQCGGVSDQLNQLNELMSGYSALLQTYGRLPA